jgi:hypothetical protein
MRCTAIVPWPRPSWGAAGDYVLVRESEPAGAFGRCRSSHRQRWSTKRKKSAKTTELAHGRKERRAALVAPAKGMAEKHDFPGLAAVARIVSKRAVRRDGNRAIF